MTTITEQHLTDRGFKDQKDYGYIKVILEDGKYIRYISIDNPKDTEETNPYLEVDLFEGNRGYINPQRDKEMYLTAVSTTEQLDELIDILNIGKF